MPTVTVSSKNQITLPAEIVRALGIRPGAKLAVEHIDGRMVVVPQPASWVSYFKGSARGVYGQTAQAVERYVAEERGSWDTPGSTDAFEDYYVANRGNMVQSVIDALARRPQYAATPAELGSELGLSGERLVGLFEETLLPRGWVRAVAVNGGTTYRLRRELAEAVAA